MDMLRLSFMLAIMSALTCMAESNDAATGQQFKPANIERGRHAYVMCATCHGERGEGMPSIGSPGLGGQKIGYIVGQLRAYRNDLRGVHPSDVQGARMRMLAKSIPDEALLTDLASYIGLLKASSGDRSVKGNLVAGKKTLCCKLCQLPWLKCRRKGRYWRTKPDRIRRCLYIDSVREFPLKSAHRPG